MLHLMTVYNLAHASLSSHNYNYYYKEKLWADRPGYMHVMKYLSPFLTQWKQALLSVYWARAMHMHMLHDDQLLVINTMLKEMRKELNFPFA